MDEKHSPDEAPKGSFVLALIFLAAFVLIYYVNFKYLASVWHID
jgi:hypothetical protein